MIRGLYVNRLSRHILTAWRRLRYSTVLLTTAPLPCRSVVFLHIQNGLLAKEDEELPLAGHVVRAMEHLNLIEDSVFIVFVWTQEVIVSDPERQVVVGAVDAVKAVRVAVRGFISPVQAFDHLLEWAVFRGNSVVVGKPDDLGDFKSEIFAQLFNELHCGKGIGAVAVSDKFKVFWQFCKSPESHAHGEDTGADATVVGHLVADDGTGGGVHDEPDIGFDAADFDVGLVSSEHFIFLVRVLVNKRLDAHRCSFAVVGNLLV